MCVVISDIEIHKIIIKIRVSVDRSRSDSKLPIIRGRWSYPPHCPSSNADLILIDYE